ncbi:MAG: RloB domain-containing protein [Mangrovibacterium sp.]
MARKAGNRTLRTRFVVLGDGQTEQYYLKHLKEFRGYNYSIRPRFFSSITFETAEHIIDELLSGGCDCVVYFTDYDTIVKQKKISKYNKFVSKYKKKSNVMICESMPSIEYWFVLHFNKTTRLFKDASDLLKELQRYIPEFSKERTFLENAGWVVGMCSDGKMDAATKNALEGLIERTRGGVDDHFPYTKAGEGIKLFESRNKLK